MEFTTLEATPREKGKRITRMLRMEGNVPCVLYGHHVEPVKFCVNASGLLQLIRSQETPLVKIEMEGNSWDCILKSVDYHPVEDSPEHADFQVLQEGEKINLAIPFRFKGIPAGQIQGGNTQYVISEAEVTCLPKDIPPFIELELTNLAIGEAIHIGDISIEGVEFNVPSQQTVVMIHAPRLKGGDALEEGEEGEETPQEEEE